MSNSDNPKLGADFELKVLDWFNSNKSNSFELHVKKPICNPRSCIDEKKNHEFDIVSSFEHIAIECKRYTWTKTWNVPSAKMGVTNEAAFYLTCLENYKRIIVMLRSYNEKRKETLADYYYRTNKHLLGDIQLMEYDPESNEMRYF